MPDWWAYMCGTGGGWDRNDICKWFRYNIMHLHKLIMYKHICMPEIYNTWMAHLHASVYCTVWLTVLFFIIDAQQHFSFYYSAMLICSYLAHKLTGVWRIHGKDKNPWLGILQLLLHMWSGEHVKVYELYNRVKNACEHISITSHTRI